MPEVYGSRMKLITISGKLFWYVTLPWNNIAKVAVIASRHNGVHFSTPQLPKVLRTWCALRILTSKCASRHSGVQFSSLISPDGSTPAALASLLFDPPEPQNIGKTHGFASLLPFRTPWSSFFCLPLLWSSLFFLSLLWLFLPLLFHLSILLEVWLLNFLRWYNLYQ